MNRDEALNYLKSRYDTVMTTAGRGVLDHEQGYLPVLDSAFISYIERYNVTETDINNTTVLASREQCFRFLLDALLYDLIVPIMASQAMDFSVDAPLTSVKTSQAYKSLSTEQSKAWQRAMSCGWAQELYSEVGAFKINMDFNEPGRGSEL